MAAVHLHTLPQSCIRCCQEGSDVTSMNFPPARGPVHRSLQAAKRFEFQPGYSMLRHQPLAMPNTAKKACRTALGLAICEKVPASPQPSAKSSTSKYMLNTISVLAISSREVREWKGSRVLT